MIKRLNCTGKRYYIFMVLTIAVATFYVALMCNKTMPFAEGWYTYYAQLINEKGLLPYRDFEYLFSPLYIYFIAFVTRFFGYDILTLRCVGILMFAIIALGVYLFITEIVGRKKAWIAAITSVTAVMYLQSEVVQIFYDYIRLMDIFAVFTVLFLIRAVKAMQHSENQGVKVNLFLCGLFNSLFINVKQNVGLIFWAYTIVLIIYLGVYFQQSIKAIVKNLMQFLLPIVAVTGAIYLLLAVTGGLKGYLSMTSGGAISAKGGMIAILFNWVPNNWNLFQNAMPEASVVLLVVVALMVALAIAEHKNKVARHDANGAWSKIADIHGGGYLLAIGLLLVMAVRHKDMAVAISDWKSVTPYFFFEIVFPAFLLFGFWFLYNIIKKQQNAETFLLWFTLAGSYVAISWGCGNSGGLAEGQATTGVAFVVAFILYGLSYQWLQILQVVAVVACIGLTIQSCTKKMVNTYNWWGADEADFWASENNIEDVPLLSKIRASTDTKAVYEEICKEITEGVQEDETIYCFPQIPIFYSLCNRWDPGVRSKVEWFDVSTDEAVEADIDILKESPPKAILMYNVGDDVYEAHESAFRKGQASGTRKMRDFLYDFAYANGYEFIGNYTTGNNELTLWIQKDNRNVNLIDAFDGGDGTIDNPYKLHTAEQLRLFSKMVNEGRTFGGQYIEQTADIDLANQDFTPIGEYSGNNYFCGTYNAAGHVIRNLKIETNDNAALFGRLGGKVYNLGIEGGNITGAYIGGIASHAVKDTAAIINCYTDISMDGIRAGGIADNFVGTVGNCFSVGLIHGTDSADVLSFNQYKEVQSVYSVKEKNSQDFDTQSTDDVRITYCTEETMKNGILVQRLNDSIYSIGTELQKSDGTEDNDQETTIELVRWKQGTDGHPVFDVPS